MKELIDRILEKVPTFKDHKSLAKIYEEVSALNPAEALVLGPGQGAETIVIKSACSSCKVTVIDKWNRWSDDGHLNFYTPKNNRASFIRNCESFAVEVDSVHSEDAFRSKNISGSWDFIYYDIQDNTEGNLYQLIYGFLEELWSNLNSGGIMMGDDYCGERLNYKMTPIVDEFYKKHPDASGFSFDVSGKSQFWLMKKKD